MNKLVILSTQRSGSTMVCDDIAGTGVLGRPSEYFIKVLQELNNNDSSQLKKLIFDVDKKGQTENGIISVKIMSNQIRGIGKALLNSGVSAEIAPEVAFVNYYLNTAFVRVIRNDKVSQAVSRIMARGTKVYHSADDISGLEGMVGRLDTVRVEEDVIYDEDIITTEIKKIKQEESYLNNFIDKYNLPVCEVIYEDAVLDRGYISEVADLLGINDFKLCDRRLKKVSGKISSEWVERYKNENDS